MAWASFGSAHTRRERPPATEEEEKKTKKTTCETEWMRMGEGGCRQNTGKGL